MNDPTDPDVLTIAEAAKLARIATQTAYLLAARGELPGAVKLGGTWRISRPALLDYLHGGNPPLEAEHPR